MTIRSEARVALYTLERCTATKSSTLSVGGLAPSDCARSGWTVTAQSIDSGKPSKAIRRTRVGHNISNCLMVTRNDSSLG